MFEKIKEFLNGKKAYLIALLFAVLVLIPVLTGEIVPEKVFAVAGAIGFGFIRLAIQKLSGNKGWRSYAAVVVVVGITVSTSVGLVISPQILEMIYGGSVVLGIVGARKAVGDLVPYMK